MTKDSEPGIRTSDTRYRTDDLKPRAAEAAEPQFLTAWEREDYEREKRGEKPLGPLAATSLSREEIVQRTDEARRVVAADSLKERLRWLTNSAAEAMSDGARLTEFVHVGDEALARIEGLEGKLTAQQAETIRVHNDRANTISTLQGKLDRAIEGLEIIAGKRQCLDNLMGNADIARSILSDLSPDGGKK